MTPFTFGNFKFLLASIATIAMANPATAASFTLDAQTSDVNKLNLGFFAGGTTLNAKLSGIISVGESSSVYADGSLEEPFTFRYPFSVNYFYASIGASGYPTNFGGDGINHFIGGGFNYDIRNPANRFGFAGKQTTDTTDPNAIRFGSVVGTFSANPSRNDWFFIGLDRILTVPEGGANLYVAVHEGYHSNNLGAYSGTIEIVPESKSVPEPGSVFGLLAVGALGAGSIIKNKLVASKNK